MRIDPDCALGAVEERPWVLLQLNSGGEYAAKGICGRQCDRLDALLKPRMGASKTVAVVVTSRTLLINNALSRATGLKPGTLRMPGARQA